MRTTILAFGAAAAFAALATFEPGDARACGGCFHEPPRPNETPSVITDHRMILSISSKQTTLYDQIRYQGSPSSFAWVLPISGTATVGLSADIVFQSLDSLTEVTIQGPILNCPPPPSRNCPGDRNAGAKGAGSFADAAAAPPSVDVVKEETVGPYETVQLKSDDPNALIDWLTTHKFVIPDDVKPILAQYTNEHFGFLAMKLVPGASVQAMRPVRVTTAGAAPVLPLRMVAAGTGATVGITLWVLGDGRYETQNFPSFTIGADELTWDFAVNASNYKLLRADKSAAFGGRGWQVESSLPLQTSTFIDIVKTGGSRFGGPRDASEDYDPVDNDAGGKSASQVRAEDMDTLFAGMDPYNVRSTRLRADLAHAALTTDLVLRAAPDQTVIPRRYDVKKSVNGVCPTYPPAPACPDDGSCSSSCATVGAVRESFSCAAGPASTFGGVATWGGIVGLVGLSAIRARRRRR
jgi:hypothetical protein